MKKGITQRAEADANHRSNEPIKLKIGRMQIEDLMSIMPTWGSGRFMALKEEVRREIHETPDDQFVVIKGTPELINSKKERQAAITALTNTVRSFGWCVRWSNLEKSFLVVRKDQWSKIRGGKK